MSTKEQLQQEIDRLREQLQIANATVASASALTSASVEQGGAPPFGGSLKLTGYEPNALQAPRAQKYKIETLTSNSNFNNWSYKFLMAMNVEGYAIYFEPEDYGTMQIVGKQDTARGAPGDSATRHTEALPGVILETVRMDTQTQKSLR